MKTKSVLFASMLLASAVAAQAQNKVVVRHLDGPGPAGPIPGHMMEKEKIAFLGVETSPVPPVLTEQLGLARGIGLVAAVVPNSPASAAGLKNNDVLTKLDDQWLIDMRQLAVLIRNHKDGDEVTITYIRGGKEASLKVKLATHEVPKMALLLSGHDKFYGLPTEGHEGMRHVLTMMQDAGEPGLEHPGARIIERHIGTHPGGPEATILNMNRVHIVYSDDDGSLEVKHSDTGRQLTAKDKQGKVVFEGPIDSDTDRKAVPDAVRTRLDNLEHTDKLEYLPDEHFKAEPTPTAALEEGANVYYRKEGVGPSLPAI